VVAQVGGGSLDERHMRRALFHAARGRGRTTPNPMVGAVVVSADGVVVGHGWHERAGSPHAEIHALDAAGERARGATLYVTLEPCCHTGRTGPCTQRIIHAGINRVVAAMQDPDARVAGQGFAALRARDISVDEGVCAQEAMRLNRAFVITKTLGRPLVVLKAATSLDGCVAAARGQRTAITSAEANVTSQLLRASVDAIAIGSETALVDDPLLTTRECHRVRPLVRVVFDRRLRTRPAARLFSTLADGPVIIVTGSRRGDASARAEALESAGAVVVEADGLQRGVEALLRWDVSTLLVEGGPSLQGALARIGLVDAVHLIVAPRMLGPSGVRWLDADVLPPALLSPVAAEPRGTDIWLEADVHRNH
jgi:diaminohydroxyphosphoribosylaminopyrimidine deaminase / 5-amino-6-(5-phosphoribosylamino)uracil reductase